MSTTSMRTHKSQLEAVISLHNPGKPRWKMANLNTRLHTSHETKYLVGNQGPLVTPSALACLASICKPECHHALIKQQLDDSSWLSSNVATGTRDQIAVSSMQNV